MTSANTAILQIICPDQAGLVAKIADFIHQHQGNIVDLGQHTDPVSKTFLMRIEWELKSFKLKKSDLKKYLKTWEKQYQMDIKLFFRSQKLKLGILVSKYPHCLEDLLMRQSLGELSVKIPVIISNHPDSSKVAKYYGIPYQQVSVEEKNKVQAEAKILKILKKHQVDFVVLARYMQILSQDFIAHYPNQIINIHHSFLPAFKGGKPYHQAYSRGVKIIGATSHYVTAELDNGPIIEQRVARVSHRHGVEDLIRLGRDQERLALAEAVRLHSEHRILAYENKTVVFE
ncbi:MAG: formyltetrahydrofolate deformylase [Deltaproteobacteria bacterium]|nr:formyltetrahydrofolate deformylase [Deltaproteobacteria bacterium]